SIASIASRARAGSVGTSRRAAAAWTTITETLWVTTSCSSPAIRRRSAATASRARRSRSSSSASARSRSRCIRRVRAPKLTAAAERGRDGDKDAGCEGDPALVAEVLERELDQRECDCEGGRQGVQARRTKRTQARANRPRPSHAANVAPGHGSDIPLQDDQQVILEDDL